MVGVCKCGKFLRKARQAVGVDREDRIDSVVRSLIIAADRCRPGGALNPRPLAEVAPEITHAVYAEQPGTSRGKMLRVNDFYAHLAKGELLVWTA